MKTTIELPDELVLAAKRTALERRTTLRQLVQQGLEKELRIDTSPRPAHPLQRVVVVGQNDWSANSADDYVAEQRADW